MRLLSLVSLLVLLAADPARCAQGISGRAALGGTLVEAVQIRVYPLRPGGFGPLTGDAPVARAVTAVDGSYAVELPAGRYVVEGIRKQAGNPGQGPEAGDLYCLYSGSPVTVVPDRRTTVGLYLTAVAAEKRAAAAGSRITGRLTFKGEPLEKAYLYGYTSVDGMFHGPAEMMQPVAKGAFSVALAPGTYYLLARKRAKGGPYGPIELGDKLNFYALNPVRVRAGEEVRLEIPLAERLGSLEQDETTNQGTKIRVLDSAGRPLAAYYVLVYATPERSGPPVATSALTDKNGETSLNLPPGAKYLRSRATLGGPLGEEEVYADGEAAPQPEGGGAATVLTARRKK